MTHTKDDDVFYKAASNYPKRPYQLDGFGWLSPKTRTITVKSGVHVEMTWDIEGKNCDVVLSPAAPVQEPGVALDRIKQALPEFRQQDDYLLAHGASLLSEQSHEIIHIDTAFRIAGVALPAAPVPLTNAPTKEMIDAAERIDWADSDVRGNIVNMWQAMCAAAPSQPAPVQEPVAQKTLRMTADRKWKIRNAFWRMYNFGKADNPVSAQCEVQALDMFFAGASVDTWKTSVVPLYTTPPAAQTAVPLTDEQIRWHWSNAHNDTTDRMAFEVFARAIEAAHGITKGQP
jgi:hypothetical protein